MTIKKSIFCSIFAFVMMTVFCTACAPFLERAKDSEDTTQDEYVAPEYSVRFYANSADCTGDMTDQVFYYDEEKELSLNLFTKAYYKFVGWNTEPDGSGVSYKDGELVENLADENSDVIDLYAQWKKDDTFDENNVVFKFGAISDCHTAILNGKNANKFRNALQQLSEYDVDALMIVGDFISTGASGKETDRKRETKNFVKILKEASEYSFGKNVILTAGNHDAMGNEEYSMIPNLKAEEYLGLDYFDNNPNYVVEDYMFSTSAIKGQGTQNDVFQHWNIGGYHFICVEPYRYNKTLMREEYKVKLDELLANITQENPDQFVFFATHPPIQNTVYGSYDDQSPGSEYWRTDDLTEILSKYPQVIAFSGHTHDPLGDERCIMQTEFTSLNCGSIINSSVERYKYANLKSATGTGPVDNNLCSTGLLVEIDVNGNARITRLDFYRNNIIKNPWEISYPNSAGFLDKYSRATRVAADQAPITPTLADIKTSYEKNEDNTYNINLSFQAATDDDFVHHYKTVVKKVVDGVETVIKENRMLTDHYLYLQPHDEMPSTFSCIIKDIKESGEYIIYISALDSWDKESYYSQYGSIIISE